MLTARIDNMVRNAAPGEDLTFIVMLEARRDPGVLEGTVSRRERLEALRSYYRNVKSPVIKAFQEYAEDGMSVTSELDGTPQFVVMGPADLWKRVLAENRDLLDRPDLSLVPNSAVASVR